MTNAFKMADIAFGGGLADWLIQAREDGKSYQSIVFLLATHHGMQVGNDTVRRWTLDALDEREARLAS